MRRLTVAAATVGFVASVYLANWLVIHIGPVRVWPSVLLAPAGVYVVGVAFLLRDTVQRLGSKKLALAGIAAGTALSAIVSPRLALASGLAFAISEIVGLIVFASGARRSLGLGVASSQIVAALLDSFVFLTVAFGSLAFFPGQFVAKLMVVALAFPVVLLARKAVPA